MQFEQPYDKASTPTSRSPSSQGSSTRKYVITEQDWAKLKVSSGLIKAFKSEAMRLKKNKKHLTIQIPKSVYYNVQDVILDHEDMLDWCLQREVGTSHISIFMK